MSFNSIYSQGFARVAAVSTPITLGAPAENARAVLEAARVCDREDAAVVVFSELALTGRTAGILFHQQELLRAVRAELSRLVLATRTLKPIFVVGAPLQVAGGVYNCAVFVHAGKILGVTPKSILSSAHGWEEPRFFRSPSERARSVDWEGEDVPFGAVQVDVTDVPGLRVGAEIGEELRAPISPSARASLWGTTVIANPTAIPGLVGQRRAWEELVAAHSQVTATAYVCAAPGPGESSTNLAWDGQSLIYEAGLELARAAVPGSASITFADVDLEALAQERLNSDFFRGEPPVGAGPQVVRTQLGVAGGGPLRREVSPFPFLQLGESPQQRARRNTDYADVFTLQIDALVRRMDAIGQPKLIIGVSGGLDSTHALLVCAGAMKALGRPASEIYAYSMPGFGTTEATRLNARTLAELLGVTFAELDIRPAAQEMLAAMGHPFAAGQAVHDVTFENVQAGLRTDYLFRLANQNSGIVVGTGDLSELALGWCTYGVGDQMSHYAVNAGMPKTLLQALLRWRADRPDGDDQLRATLEAVADTQISPELIPADSPDAAQLTEAAIGPYELQDFTLYYLLRYGFGPRRIAYLTSFAWGHKYSREEILRWMKVFYRRFFANQFKRSALPDGPRLLLAGSLSPRMDWPMPSDGSPAAWLAQIEDLQDMWE